MTARRLLCLLPVLTALVSSVGFTACGTSEDRSDIAEGEPVQLGQLQYNVLFSRFLNPYDVEDKEYLVGQPAPGRKELYLGVFMKVLNKGDTAANMPAQMTIVDTEHDRYSPLPSKSPNALHLGGRLGPDDQAPALDSTAQSGPIEGSMVLFLLPNAATENRPLDLIIPGQGGAARVVLDI
jgi:hypothetical protein